MTDETTAASEAWPRCVHCGMELPRRAVYDLVSGRAVGWQSGDCPCLMEQVPAKGLGHFSELRWAYRSNTGDGELVKLLKITQEGMELSLALAEKLRAQRRRHQLASLTVSLVLLLLAVLVVVLCKG